MNRSRWSSRQIAACVTCANRAGKTTTLIWARYHYQISRSSGCLWIIIIKYQDRAAVSGLSLSNIKTERLSPDYHYQISRSSGCLWIIIIKHQDRTAESDAASPFFRLCSRRRRGHAGSAARRSMNCPVSGSHADADAPECHHAAVNALRSGAYQRGVSAEALALAIRELSGRVQFPAV